MDPISALIGAGSSVFSSVLGNIIGSDNTDKTNQMNYKIAQMNNQYNERMLEKQMAYNTDMWNKENAYNDPSAQRQRLEAAGINPFLAMHGGNSAGTASSAMGVNPPSAQGATMQSYKPDFSGISQAAQMIYQKQKMDADIAKTKSEQRGIELQNERQWISNMFAMQEHLNNLAHSSMDYDTKKQNLRNMSRIYDNLGYEGQLYQAQKMYYDYQSEGIDLENTYRSIRNEKAPELFKLEISQRANDILYKKAQTNMTNTQAVHEVEKMIETQARSAGLDFSNAQAKSMSRALVFKNNMDAYWSQFSPNDRNKVHMFIKPIANKLFDTDWKNLPYRGYKKPWD